MLDLKNGYIQNVMQNPWASWRYGRGAGMQKAPSVLDYIRSELVAAPVRTRLAQIWGNNSGNGTPLVQQPVPQAPDGSGGRIVSPEAQAQLPAGGTLSEIGAYDPAKYTGINGLSPDFYSLFPNYGGRR